MRLALAVLASIVVHEVFGITFSVRVATARVGALAALVTLAVVSLDLFLANDEIIRQRRRGRRQGRSG